MTFVILSAAKDPLLVEQQQILRSLRSLRMTSVILSAAKDPLLVEQQQILRSLHSLRMTFVILSEAKDLLFAAQKGCAICVRDGASSDMRRFFVYILASRSRRLYVGITNDLFRRVLAHRNGESAFTARYRINRLVYVESCTDVRAAITREKQIKGWLRKKKLELIDSFNPKWDDLAATWLSEEAATTDPSLRSG